MRQQYDRKIDPQGVTDVNALPRVVIALRLRRMGYTYEDIAEQAGYSNGSHARKAIKAAESRIIRDDARALVNLQLDMIQFALVQAVMPKIEKGDLWAVDRLNTLLKRQSELLGLDAKEAPLVDGPAVKVIKRGGAQA